MARYLIESNGKGRLIDVPSGLDSDEYGRLQTAFASEAGGAEKYASMWPLWNHQQHNGVYWDEELAGPGGCSFLVFKFPQHDADVIAQVVSKLRRERDVVELEVLPLVFI